MTAPTSCYDALPGPVTTFNDWFCPAGSIYPTLCGPGLYGDLTTTCTACPAGKYCWPVEEDPAASGIWVPKGITGDCDHAAGFICQGGSWSPKPQYNGLDFLIAGSQDFTTYNGPTIAGYIAQTGAATQLACVPGTFNPSFYQLTCIDCYAGRYCPDSGMRDISDYICKEGYICHSKMSIAKPVTAVMDGLTVLGEPCPIGYHCPYFLSHKLPCPDGFTSEEAALAFCSTCPSGHFCDNDVSTGGSVSKIVCVTDSICDLGEKRQPNCAIGMFELDNYCRNCT